jgi:very-short-patch-repair endonuclease
VPLLPSPLRGGVGGGGPQMIVDVIESTSMDNRQREFARRMRAEPTEAERVLWQRLRHHITLAGSHFRRQAVIGPFIVDFASRRAKLVIELDGGQHDWQQASDQSRTRLIEAAGFRVLRFWNNDVLSNLDGVLQQIQCALPPTRSRSFASASLKERRPPKAACRPSPQGGGELRQRRPRRPRKERH